MSRQLEQDRVNGNVVSEFGDLRGRVNTIERTMVSVGGLARKPPQIDPRMISWMALGLPLYFQNIRGFWPMSSRFGDVYDYSGQGRTLTDNNSVLGGVQGFAPYATFDGATEYFSRADELPLNPNNFSIGGWFRFDNPTIAANEFLIAKWLTTGDQRSYVLLRNTSEQLQLSISTAGTSGTQVNLTSDVLIADTHWHFLAGVLDPSTSWSVIVDGEPKTSTSSVPGNPFNNTSDFTIGASHGGGSYLDGDGTLCFLSGATLTIDVLLAYYHLTRAAFGV